MTWLQLKLRVLEATSKTRFQTFGDTFGCEEAPKRLPTYLKSFPTPTCLVKMVPKSILETS